MKTTSHLEANTSFDLLFQVERSSLQVNFYYPMTFKIYSTFTTRFTSDVCKIPRVLTTKVNKREQKKAFISIYILL